MCFGGGSPPPPPTVTPAPAPAPAAPGPVETQVGLERQNQFVNQSGTINGPQTRVDRNAPDAGPNSGAAAGGGTGINM